MGVSLISLPLLTACLSEKGFEGSGISEEAPTISYYAGMGEDCCGEDPHPVHGVETSDGSFILGGKFIDLGGGTNGFVVKLSNGTSEQPILIEEGAQGHEWTYTFGQPNSFDAVNSVAAKDDDIFVAGVKQSETLGMQRFLAKLDSTSGEQVWSMVLPTFGSLESAFESIVLTNDGGAILAGFTDGDQGGVEGFKSYGNPHSGKANVMFFSASQLESEHAPEEAMWEQTYSDFGSIRSIKPADEGFVFVTAQSEESYVVAKIDENGDQEWSQPLNYHGEATDIAVVTNSDVEIGYAVTGHNHFGEGVDGSLTFLELNGDIRWTKSYGNPAGGIREFEGLGEGNPSLIFDECWGIQPTGDGSVVVACGTGIEDCSLGNVGLGLECRNDPRRKWRSLMMKISSSSEQEWYRTDSFYHEGEDVAAATAAEHVIRMRDGRFAAVIDQDFGIGLLVLETE